MKHISIITALFVLVAVSFTNVACMGGASPEEGGEVKSMASYYEEADKTITTENADAELAKLMKEIDADTE
jgi:hypothetical protein